MPEQALALLARGLQDRLGDHFLSLYLYGSAAMEDFRPGWSDLDLLCLTRAPLSPAQADALLPLRQSLAEAAPAVPFLRRAEGAVLSLAECRSCRCVRAVVWGSRGERLSDGWLPDAFTLLSLHQCGCLLAGKEVRASLPRPDASLLRGGRCGAFADHPPPCGGHRQQPVFLRMAAGYRPGAVYPAHGEADCQDRRRGMGPCRGTLPGCGRPVPCPDAPPESGAGPPAGGAGLPGGAGAGHPALCRCPGGRPERNASHRQNPPRRFLRSVPERCMMVQTGNERRHARCCRTSPSRNPSASG